MQIVNDIKHVPNYKKYVRIDGHFEKETTKAICFSLVYGNVWLPKSKIIGVPRGLCHTMYYVEKWLLTDNNKRSKII